MKKLVALAPSLAVLVAAVDMILLYKNHALQSRLAACQVQVDKKYHVEVGTPVEPLTGYDRDGNPLQLDFRGNKPTILLVFSPHCGVCNDNWSKWDSLLDASMLQRVRVAAVDLTSSATEEYFRQRAMDRFNAVFKETDPQRIMALKMRLVPQTILIDRRGTVLGTWLGELNDQRLREIRELAYEETPATYVAWRDGLTKLERIGAFETTPVSMPIAVGEETQLVSIGWITPSLPQVLGTPPLLGHDFPPEHEGLHTLLISHRLWQGQFGGSPDVIGKVVSVEQGPATVIGVLPAEFCFPVGADAWMPLRFSATIGARQAGMRNLGVVGRLGDASIPTQAIAQLEALSASIAERLPKTHKGWKPFALSLQDALTEKSEASLLALSLAVGLLVILTCFNLSNVFAARNAERRDELAVRTALGADRLQLTALLMRETILLGAIGGAIGLALGAAALPLMQKLIPAGIPSMRLGIHSVLWGLSVSLATGVAMGMATAWRLSRRSHPLSVSLRCASLGPESRRLSRAMSVVQILIAFVMIVASSSLFLSAVRLSSRSPGFDPSGIYTLEFVFHRNVSYLAESARSKPGASLRNCALGPRCPRPPSPDSYPCRSGSASLSPPAKRIQTNAGRQGFTWSATNTSEPWASPCWMGASSTTKTSAAASPSSAAASLGDCGPTERRWDGS